MAKISKRDVLVKYRRAISASRKWRQEDSYDRLWRRMIDMYRGKHYENMSEEDRLLVNMSFSTINVIGPSVSVNHPKITVGARRPEDGDRATITEAIINYWWRHYDYQKELRRAVDDYLICGHGWIKVGYKFVEEERVVEQTPMDEEYDVIDTMAEGSNVETERIILEDRPFVERVSPFDVYVDPDATCMEDARWIAQRVRRPLLDVRGDRRYNKTARNECSPSAYTKWGEDTERPRQKRDVGDSYVDVWEYYDIAKGTMAIFCEGGDNFLVDPEKNPYTFGHPFVMLRNYDIPEHFYPMGELEAIEPLQQELNETRTQMMNHRKRFSRKWLYKESAFDADGRQALESDEDNIMVPVVSDEPLGNIIVPMPAVINAPDMYNVSSLILEDIDRISGVGEFMRGGQSEIRRTATEAAMMQDASNARTSDKLAAVEGAIAECASRLIQLAQQYMTGEQVARVVGSSAMPMWVTFDRGYITGEFDFEVEGGSTQPVNESFRRQMALQMVDAMAPFAGTGILNMPMLARHVLQYGFGVKNAEAFLNMPQQDPMMQGAPQQGAPPPQGLPQGPQGPPPMPQEGAQQPLPSSIPPQVLSMLQNSTGGLNNMEAM